MFLKKKRKEKQTKQRKTTVSVLLCFVVFCCVLLCFVVFCCVLLCFVVFCCVLLFFLLFFTDGQLDSVYVWREKEKYQIRRKILQLSHKTRSDQTYETSPKFLLFFFFFGFFCFFGFFLWVHSFTPPRTV